MKDRQWLKHLCLIEKLINLKISQIRTIEKSERVAEGIEFFIEKIISVRKDSGIEEPERRQLMELNRDLFSLKMALVRTKLKGEILGDVISVKGRSTKQEEVWSTWRELEEIQEDVVEITTMGRKMWKKCEQFQALD